MIPLSLYGKRGNDRQESMKAFWKQCFFMCLLMLGVFKLQAKEIFKPLNLMVKTPVALKHLEFIPFEIQYHGVMSLKNGDFCYIFCVGNKDWVYLKKEQKSYRGFTLKQADLDHKSVLIEKDNGELYKLSLGQKAYITYRFNGSFYDRKSRNVYGFSENNLSFEIDKRKIVLKQDPEDLKRFYMFEIENGEKFCCYCLSLEVENK